jgi:uncharacterized protein DUF6326
MDSVKKDRTPLDDVKIHVKMKISALWVSVMFCYIYGDYFGLYRPGTVQGMLEGKMGGIGPATQMVLLGTTVMMTIPSLMVFFSLALKPNLNRWLNIIFGAIYTLIILITMWDWAFFIFLGIVEMSLTGLVVWYAWTWPKQDAT